MALTLDVAFVAEWHPKYTEDDEGEYDAIRQQVSADISRSGTMSMAAFFRIAKWKGANRRPSLLPHDSKKYERDFAERFRACLAETDGRKLPALFDPKPSGVGAPFASTLVHFMCPTTMPIIDRRTAEVLQFAQLLPTRQTTIKHYEPFRLAIRKISGVCPGYSLRQIDRALFAYHKHAFEPEKKRKRTTSCC